MRIISVDVDPRSRIPRLFMIKECYSYIWNGKVGYFNSAHRPIPMEMRSRFGNRFIIKLSNLDLGITKIFTPYRQYNMRLMTPLIAKLRHQDMRENNTLRYKKQHITMTIKEIANSDD